MIVLFVLEAVLFVLPEGFGGDTGKGADGALVFVAAPDDITLGGGGGEGFCDNEVGT